MPLHHAVAKAANTAGGYMDIAPNPQQVPYNNTLNGA